MTPEILHHLRLPWPTPWAEVFGRKAPLLIEIGFGGGQFLVALARQRPSYNVLGVEISLPSLRKGARKLKRAGLQNGRVLQGDAKAVLWMLCTPASVAEVHINFPDPWPKAAHQQRRLIDADFLHLLATRIPFGAPLEIATDHAEYASAIMATLQDSPYFVSRSDTAFFTADPLRLRTKYEQIALAEGRTCCYFKWQRTEVYAPDDFPVPLELSMPHVVMQSPIDLDAVSARFEPWRVAANGTTIKYLEMYRSTRDGKLLVEVYVNEPPFHQRVCLTIRPRRAGDWVVGLHDMGFPRPTPGMHTAVHHLVTWLRSLHPGVTILNSTLQIEVPD